MSVKFRQMVKVSISELLFFIYVRDIHERKSTKKFFFKNFIPYSFYEHVKLPSAATRFSKYFLKANFETIFWEKPWPPHSYLTFTGKYPKRNVPKNCCCSHGFTKSHTPKPPKKNHKKYQIWEPLSQDALISTQVFWV